MKHFLARCLVVLLLVFSPVVSLSAKADSFDESISQAVDMIDVDKVYNSSLKAKGTLDEAKRKFQSFKDYVRNYIEQLKRDFEDIRRKVQKFVDEVKKK